MGLADRFKRLTKKAEDTAAEHADQIHQAVAKAEVAADERTGGRYHDQIQKAGAKADEFVEELKPPSASPEAEGSGAAPAGQGGASEQAPPSGG
jgi:DNA-binding protein H-NS